MSAPVFLAACNREPTPFTPIWIMRQAGRYMPEYRAVRAKMSFLELCHNPTAAAEVTITAVEQLGVDAAIIFADILLVLEPMGVGLEFTKGDGPVIHRPVRTAADIDGLQPVPPDSLSFVYDAVRQARAGLKVPLIGFAGAPFTLAAYLIEGGSSHHYNRTRAFMLTDQGAWNALMDRLVTALIGYVNGQIAAGAQAIQLFDSWIGAVAPIDYRALVLPHMQRLIAGLTPGVPIIYFGTGTGGLLEAMKAAGSQVIGVDWRVDLDAAWARVGYDVAIQGNMDPATLLAPIPEIRRKAELILGQAGGRPGHIFNLGHGVTPDVPVDHVRALIDTVHELSAKRR